MEIRQRIALCMIVKDEEELLEECLDSVKGLVDEIIIADTGSKDRTKEIAGKFTSNVFDFKWNDNFSEARNFSLSKANAEWIVVLDADERIDSESIKAIRGLIKDKDYDAYQLIQRNYTNFALAPGFRPLAGSNLPFSGFYDNPLTRLFKNKEYIKFQGIVHEGVDKSIIENNGKIGKSAIVIHHFREIKQKEEEKQQYYLGLYKKKVEENPDDYDSYFGMGLVYQNFINDEEKAAECYKKALELKPDLETASINLSILYIEKNKLQEAKEILDKALEFNPESIALLNNLTTIYIAEDKIDEAIKTVKKVTKIDDKNLGAIQNFAFCLVRTGKAGEAIELYKKALGINPDFAEARVNLGLAYSIKGQKEEAIREIEEALRINPQLKRAEDMLKRLKNKESPARVGVFLKPKSS